MTDLSTISLDDLKSELLKREQAEKDAKIVQELRWIAHEVENIIKTAKYENNYFICVDIVPKYNDEHVYHSFISFPANDIKEAEELCLNILNKNVGILSLRFDFRVLPITNQTLRICPTYLKDLLTYIH